MQPIRSATSTRSALPRTLLARKLVIGLLIAGALIAGPPQTAFAESSQSEDEVRQFAQSIDEQISKRWDAEHVTPAPSADDAEFLRRVFLDITGKIPCVTDTRAFLANPSPDKRRELVERLLAGPGYITHFTDVWRAAILPEVDSDIQLRFASSGFEMWLRTKLAENTNYAEVVREILTAPLSPGLQNGFVANSDAATPLAFYAAKQLKPEALAAASSRLFLGVRLECAQCHDHPFDTWQRNQFWGLAACFSGLERSTGTGIVGQIQDLFARPELSIPGTDQVVQAAFLDGNRPQRGSASQLRADLAEWVTSSRNPYFARAAVNRMWGHFFGIGLVDPIDDFSEKNPPSHPDLLDDLAHRFAAQSYDLKFLVRGITASKTYQLTSSQAHPSQEQANLFARMSVKGLTPEQVFDNVAQAIGYYEPDRPFLQNRFAARSPRIEFGDLFANNSDSPVERQTTILQALTMMNGDLIADATSLERSSTLSAIATVPWMSTEQRIETLYLAALTRPPRPDELKRCVEYVGREGGRGPQHALEDLYWALLNSSEFLLNH